MDFSVGHRCSVLVHDRKRKVTLAEFLDASKRLLAPLCIGLTTLVVDVGIRQLFLGKVLSVVQQAESPEVELLHFATDKDCDTALSIRSILSGDERHDNRLPCRSNFELA